MSAGTPIYEVAPHLCGFEANRARRRLLLVLKAFIDESGKTEPPVFVMAGFLARAEQWAAFNDEWRAVLDEPHPIEAFHMVDSEWTGDRKRLGKLIDVIRRHVITGIAVTVFHDDYEAIFKGRVAKRMDRPYFLMYHSIMTLAMEWEIENGMDEPIDFIFDEQHGESDYLQSIFTRIKEMAPPEIQRRFGSRPIHADDKKVLPLQAADILAWSLRRVGYLAVQGKPPDDFLSNLFRKIPFKRTHWTREMLAHGLLRSAEKNQREGKLFKYQFDTAARNMDVIISGYNKQKLQQAKPNETVQLTAIPAKEMARFLLVHKCPGADSPHLHRRSTNECLAGRTSVAFSQKDVGPLA